MTTIVITSIIATVVYVIMSVVKSLHSAIEKQHDRDVRRRRFERNTNRRRMGLGILKAVVFAVALASATLSAADTEAATASGWGYLDDGINMAKEAALLDAEANAVNGNGRLRLIAEPRYEVRENEGKVYAFIEYKIVW